MTFIVDSAERAERLRQAGTRVVFLTGSEISLFTSGFLPGDNLQERLGVMTEPARMRAALPELHARVRLLQAPHGRVAVVFADQWRPVVRPTGPGLHRPLRM